MVSRKKKLGPMLNRDPAVTDDRTRFRAEPHGEKTYPYSGKREAERAKRRKRRERETDDPRMFPKDEPESPGWGYNEDGPYQY